MQGRAKHQYMMGGVIVIYRMEAGSMKPPWTVQRAGCKVQDELKQRGAGVYKAPAAFCRSQAY